MDEPVIPTLADGFAAARYTTTIGAALLLLDTLAGVTFPGKFPYLDVAIPDRRVARTVVALVIVYGLVRTTIEWFQSDVRRRKKAASRVDLVLTYALAIAALASWGTRIVPLPRLNVEEWVTLVCLGAIGVASGFLISQCIWFLPFIRAPKYAAQLCLPRIPVAAGSTFLMAATWFALIIPAVEIWQHFRGFVLPHWPVVAGLPLAITLGATAKDFLSGRREQSDGSFTKRADYIYTMADLFAWHDTVYCQDGNYRRYVRCAPPTPLYTAAHAGDGVTVSRLLASGSNPDDPGGHGWTPLMIAAAEQHSDVVALLLASGAHPNRVNTLGRTALMYAARYGNEQIVRQLLAAGAKPDLRGFYFETPALGAAAQSGHDAVVGLLLDAGANPELSGKDGSPQNLAEMNGHGAIAARLRKEVLARDRAAQLAPAADPARLAPG